MKKLMLIGMTLTMFTWMINGLQAKSILHSEISPEEALSLHKMYEEEKLAQNIYQELYNTWELPVFKNIAESELRHIEAISSLMEYKNIDQNTESGNGKFSNSEIQKLYEELLKKGKNSITDALLVGAEIEDLDIFDLDQLINSTKDPDIQIVFNNLKRGSTNHLRSFCGLLDVREVTYSPKYLSEESFDEILTSNFQYGNGNRKNGNWGRGMQSGRRNGRQVCNNQGPCLNSGPYQSSNSRRGGRGCRRSSY